MSLPYCSGRLDKGTGGCLSGAVAVVKYERDGTEELPLHGRPGAVL